ncbi:MAG: EAL domain-containing protein [Pseudomonadota bacterium]
MRLRLDALRDGLDVEHTADLDHRRNQAAVGLGPERGHDEVSVDLQPVGLQVRQPEDRGVPGAETNRRLISAMIEIGGVLDVETIAEGVETEAHAQLLRGLGCDYLQGYAIARPLPFDELLAWLAARDGFRGAARA